MFADLRLAWRALRATPLATAAVALSLTLGLGFALVLFGAADALLWRALPYRAPDELVLLSRDVGGSDAARRVDGVWSWPAVGALRARAGAPGAPLADVAAFSARQRDVQTPAGPRRVEAELVSGNYFALLGVRALAGRPLLPDDERTGAPAALLGASLWRSAFAADPGAVGRTVRVDGRPVTVVGVLPDGFGGQSGRAAFWLTTGYELAVNTHGLRSPNTGWLQAVGRLRAGLSPDAARPALAALARALGRELMMARPPAPGAPVPWRVDAARLRDVKVSPAFRRVLLLLLASAGLLAVAASANTATVLLVRAERGRGAMGVRAALGASPARLARAAAAEALLLAALGGAGALLVVRWAGPLLARVAPHEEVDVFAGQLESLASVRLALDGRLLAAAFGLAAAAALVAGAAPVLRARRTDPARLVTREVAGALPGRRRLGARGALVAAQVAVSAVLLAGASLLGRSFANAARAPLGFQPQGVLSMRFDLPDHYAGRRDVAFAERLRAAAATMPGVRAVSLALYLPLSRQEVTPGLVVDGNPAVRDTAPSQWGPLEVGPDYFEALGVRVLEGRGVTAADVDGARRVAVVSAAAARTFWPGRSPVGRTIRFPIFGEPDPITVVGVVGDVPYGALGGATAPAVYRPAYQTYARTFTLLVRHDGPAAPVAAALGRAVRALDPELPVPDARPLADHVADARAHITLAAQLFAAFAVIAVVLAALGVYGVAAGALAARTREFAVRAAVGATGARLAGLAARDVAVLAGAGLAAGLAVAAAGARALGALLYGVPPLDATAFAGAAAGLALAVGLAAWGPARRAARADPAGALRAD